MKVDVWEHVFQNKGNIMESYMKILPSAYIINKFYQYSSKVTYQRISNSYRGTCFVCREGSSLSKKTRLNYYVNKGMILCYNCQKTWSPLNWIKEVAGLSYREIMDEASTYDYNTLISEDIGDEITKPKNTQTLPYNSINLSDEIQVKYYSDVKVVQDAINLIKNRRLDTAINKALPFFLSLEDYIHKNRLCIPFRDPDNKIRFYQTRAIYPKDEEIGKYLSKLNSDKTIFGLNNINNDLDYLFIFEGPIDSMFIRNGISMAGLRISESQKGLLGKYFLHKHIWILDNQLENQDVFDKNMDLIDRGETIFIWPKQYKPFKDLNEICCKLKLDSIDPQFIISNSYNGLTAKIKLNEAVTF